MKTPKHFYDSLWTISLFGFVTFILVITVLGFITPDYNHFRDTISILAIKKYGWIMELNFIVFGISLSIMSLLAYRQMSSLKLQKVWKTIVIFVLVFLFIITLFKADDTIDYQTLITNITPSGLTHYIALLTYFILAPFGVYALSSAMRTDTQFLYSARFTLLAGNTAAILCYLWTYFYASNLFFNYLGLLQKLIALITLSWLIGMLLVIRPKSLKSIT